MENNELKDSDIVQLGPKDGVFNNNLEWLIFELDTLDKKGIWSRLQTEIQIMEYQGQVQDLTMEEIEDYLYHNSDIDLNIHLYDEEMPDVLFFKTKDKIYCYTTGKKTRGKNKIYARFYFELEDIIKN